MVTKDELNSVLDSLVTTPLDIPEGLEQFCARNIGPRIFLDRKSNRILKVGKSVKMAEAEAMRYVAANTQIPVPIVHDAYMKDERCYIWMSKVEGELLVDVWPTLDSQGRKSVSFQLKDFLNQLQSLRGRFYGALWDQPSEDIFFAHLPFLNRKFTYGPYVSRQEYNEGLLQALEYAGPDTSLRDANENLVKDTRMEEEIKIFTHGDLHLRNILIDKSSIQITGIIDWAEAGFSIRGREYYEAKCRSRDSTWQAALDEIFSDEERAPFDLLRELDQAMTRYTFI